MLRFKLNSTRRPVVGVKLGLQYSDPNLRTAVGVRVSQPEPADRGWVSGSPYNPNLRIGVSVYLNPNMWAEVRIRINLNPNLRTGVGVRVKPSCGSG